jgi:hypothetical protein
MGDSGGWVVDEISHEVYGHLIAADLFGDGYVVPLLDSLEDIKERLGAQLVDFPPSNDQSAAGQTSRSRGPIVSTAWESSQLSNKAKISERHQKPMVLIDDLISSDNDNQFSSSSSYASTRPKVHNCSETMAEILSSENDQPHSVKNDLRHLPTYNQQSMTFQRVQSKAGHPQQPSLISLMFADQKQRAHSATSNHAARSTPATPQHVNGVQVPAHPSLRITVSPSDSGNDDWDDSQLEMQSSVRRAVPLKTKSEIPRSHARPIIPNSHSKPNQQAGLSPRTTRRNMLATELTESLRRHLLWERQHKPSTANTVLKRWNSVQDVASMKQRPDDFGEVSAENNHSPSFASLSWSYIPEFG